MKPNATRINLLDSGGRNIWVHVPFKDAEMIADAIKESGWTRLSSEHDYCAGIEDDGECWCQRNA